MVLVTAFPPQAQARADTADGERRAAEARTAEVLARADELRGMLEVARLELAEQRALTELTKLDAEQVTQPVQQLEGQRKARGRWARLRAAWRGE